MAKSTVTLQFDAGTAAAVQNILSTAKALDKTTDSARKFGDETAKAGDKAVAGLNAANKSAEETSSKLAGIASNIMPIASAGAAVGAAITMTLGTVKSYYEHILSLGQQAIAQTQQLNSSLAGAGQAGAIPELRKHVESYSERRGLTVNKAEADEMLGSMAEHIGAKLGDQTVPLEKAALDLAVDLHTGAPLSKDKSAQVGNTFLDMAQLRMSPDDAGGLKDVNDDTLQRFALAFVTHGGAPSPKELRLLAENPSEQMLDRIIAERQADESAKVLQKFQDSAGYQAKIDDPTELRKLQHSKEARTAEGQRLLALSHFNPGKERSEAMWNDPNLVPEGMRASLDALKRGAAKVGPLVSPDDYIGRFQTSMDAETKNAMAAREAANRLANLDRSEGQAAEEEDTRYKNIEEGVRRKYPILYHTPGSVLVPYAEDVLTRKFWELNQAGHDAMKSAGTAAFPVVSEALGLGNLAAGIAKLHDVFSHNNNLTQQQTQQIQHQTAVIQRQGNNPTLGNNNQGQQ